MWLKTSGLISNKHTLSIPACNLEIAAWKHPSMCCCTVWGDARTSRCILRLSWLMSPTWLVNLHNDQVAIRDKTVLTFSKIRSARLQVKPQWLPGEASLEVRHHPSSQEEWMHYLYHVSGVCMKDEIPVWEVPFSAGAF